MQWSENNVLLGNENKFMIMTLPGRMEGIQTNIDRKDILPSEELTLLRLEIDNELNFASYILSICKKKASRKIAVLSIHKNVIPVKANAHIIWHFCRKSDKRKLEKPQERALRIVFNSKLFTYGELLKKSNLSTLYLQYTTARYFNNYV